MKARAKLREKGQRCTSCRKLVPYVEQMGDGLFSSRWFWCLQCIENQDNFNRMVADLRDRRRQRGLDDDERGMLL